MKHFAPLLCTVWMALTTPTLVGSVEVQRQQDHYNVSIGGQAFAVFDMGKQRSRPFFREVRGADGTLLSRPISPAGGDHPHPTGLWIAVDKVNGSDFWHEQGNIKNGLVDVLQTSANPAIVHVRNQWLSPLGEVVLHEQTTIHIYENRLLAYDIQFTAGEKEVTFGDTEEGCFAFRMADSLQEEETGHVENADGLTTAQGCWGKTSDWVDYYGHIGGKTFGVAIFDHPLNFRRGRYHVRDYGLFTINPFGEGDDTQGERPPAPVTIPAGDSLRLRYGMYIHDGDTRQGRVAEVFQQWTAQTAVAATNAAGLQEIHYLAAQQTALFSQPWSLRLPPATKCRC